MYCCELQDYADIPSLSLPPSSEDLCIPGQHCLQLLAVYEVLRQFRTIVRLSPFRIEDFAVALNRYYETFFSSALKEFFIFEVLKSPQVSYLINETEMQ